MDTDELSMITSTKKSEHGVPKYRKSNSENSSDLKSLQTMSDTRPICFCLMSLNEALILTNKSKESVMMVQSEALKQSFFIPSHWFPE